MVAARMAAYGWKGWRWRGGIDGMVDGGRGYRWKGWRWRGGIDGMVDGAARVYLLVAAVRRRRDEYEQNPKL